MDMDKFKDSYDIVLGGLFDRQFGALSETRESQFQVALQYLRDVYKALIHARRQQLSKTTNTETSDLSQILLTCNDPHTGEPFTEQMVSRIFL